MQNTARRPKITVSDDGTGIVSHAGALLLTETARVTGMRAGLSAGLARWRAVPRGARPGQDVTGPGGRGRIRRRLPRRHRRAARRAGAVRPGRLRPGRVPPDHAAGRGRARGADGDRGGAGRRTGTRLAAGRQPGARRGGGLIPVDIDATIVTSHSDKQQAAPTWKKTYGFHPLTVFADHGSEGSGEPLAIVLRPGNAGSNTAADHIAATRLALAQLPQAMRRRVLIRSDSGGGTHEFLAWLAKPGRRLQYSVGFTMTDDVQDAVGKVPARAWTPRLRRRRPGPRRRLGRRADRPARPGLVAEGNAGHRAQRTPAPGGAAAVHRSSAATGSPVSPPSTRTGQLADLELRHRRRARCEDRIRNAKDTGLRNLPLHGYDQNQIWCQIVALACDLLAWTAMLALHRHRRAAGNPKRLRLRLFSARRADRPRRPPPPPAPGHPVALDPRYHRRHQPAARPGTRLTRPHHPGDQKGETPGPVEPRPPGATAGPPATTSTLTNSEPADSLRP